MDLIFPAPTIGLVNQFGPVLEATVKIYRKDAQLWTNGERI